jgi:RNA polymerase sigma-70 factor (ECF subfamily)
MDMNLDTVPLTKTITFSKEDLIRIYEENSDGLYRYAVRLLSDEDLAEECVSETFSRFLQIVRRGGGPKDNIRAYLYRMAHNWITDHYRRQPLSQVSLEESTSEQGAAGTAQQVFEILERDRVRRALLKLPPDQQQVIHLRFLEDWSHAEIANLLGKTIEATRSLQYRALATLRQILIVEDDEVSHE